MTIIEPTYYKNEEISDAVRRAVFIINSKWRHVKVYEMQRGALAGIKPDEYPYSIRLEKGGLLGHPNKAEIHFTLGDIIWLSFLPDEDPESIQILTTNGTLIDMSKGDNEELRVSFPEQSN